MTKFHHRSFPDSSALLSGSIPPNVFAFRSDRLQISYFKTKEPWTDPLPHAHQESDECFLVFQGTIRNSSSYPDKRYLLSDGTSTTDKSHHQDILSILNKIM